MIKPSRPSDSSSVRTIAILIVVIAVLYLAREIFIPLAFAITLTLILTPAVAWLQISPAVSHSWCWRGLIAGGSVG